MDRIYRVTAIWFLILFLVTSCSRSISDTTQNGNNTEYTAAASGDSGNNYDKFIYRLENGKLGSLKAGMPYKINLLSGKTTAVCTDPLCMHNTEECPFYECTGSMIDGEIMFYRRGWQMRDVNGYTGSERLCTYHVATGKARVLEECTDSLIFLGVNDDVLYYYTAEWYMDGNELACTYSLHRADGKSGKVTDLTLPEIYRTVGGYTDSSDYPNILMFDGDIIWWYKYEDDMTATFYTSSLTSENWITMEKGVKTFAMTYSGGYGYSIENRIELIDPDIGRKSGNLMYEYYLTRQKLGSGDDYERLTENIGGTNFIVTGKYIFYMEGLGSVERLTVKTDPYSYNSPGADIMNGCRIIRINHDGSEPIVVSETSEYYFAGTQYIHDSVLFGYYEDDDVTYLAFFIMEKDENNELTLSKDTLILNTATGEWTRSFYGE